MPSKYPVLTPKEIIERLSKYGFKKVSQKGSHQKLSNGGRIVIVPMHDEVAKGTLKSIINTHNFIETHQTRPWELTLWPFLVICYNIPRNNHG